MTRAFAPILAPASSSLHRKRWADADVLTLVTSSAALFAPGASVLPLTRFTGVLVFPVVVWDLEAVAWRSQVRPDPILDEGTIARLVDDPSVGDPPAPLAIHGFVSVAEPPAALRALSGLRALGRTIAGVSAGDRLSPELQTRFDLQGTAVVALESQELLVPGDPGPAPGARYDSFWRRVRVEQLYSLAVQAGCRLF